MATQSDTFRKPESGMWDFFVKNCNGNVKPGRWCDNARDPLVDG